jgi:RNA polymerase sigma-B factor
MSTASLSDQQVADLTIPRELGNDAPDAPPACDPEVWLLHVRFQRTADADALEALVEEYRAMALALARRMHRGAEPVDDLQQIALEALLRCLHGFDCGQGTPFVGYATPTILGAIKRHYRDQGWSLRVPRRAHELAGPVRDASERLTARLGRAPTSAELAQEVGVPAAELEAAEVALRARGLVRLDAPVHGDEGELGSREVPVDDDGFDRAEGRAALHTALEQLDERERTVLGLYFFEEMTQTQIAERFGVSQMQVSRWIRSALARLRGRMEAVAS